MLETGIPKVLWRTKQYNDQKLGEYRREEEVFSKDVDTNYDSMLGERQPSSKSFSFKRNVTDFGLSDAISDKKFTFEKANNNLLLNDQLPSANKFRQSSGLGGLLKYCDDMAPKKDYRYVDPQFYEYRLNGMTLERMVDNRRRMESDFQTQDGYNLVDDPEQYDPTSRAIDLRFNKDREPFQKAVVKLQSGFRGNRDRERTRGYNDIEIDDLETGLLQLKKEEISEEGKAKLKPLRDKVQNIIKVNTAARNERFKDLRDNEKADAFRAKSLKKDHFNTFKGLTDRRKKARAKGLEISVDDTPYMEKMVQSSNKNYELRSSQKKGGIISEEPEVKASAREPKRKQSFVKHPTEDEAQKTISKLVRSRIAKKKAKEELIEAGEIKKQALLTSSPTQKEKMRASAEKREKEAIEFKQQQVQTAKLRESTELQIKTFEALKEKLEKLNPKDLIPTHLFKDLRPVYALKGKGVGTKYKVQTVLKQLADWDSDINKTKNAIAEEKSKEAGAKKKEDELYKDPKTQKSMNILSAEDLLQTIPEKRDSKSRERKSQINPSAKDIPEIVSGRGGGSAMSGGYTQRSGRK